MPQDRLVREQAFHDAQARQRAAWFAAHPEAYVFPDAAYLDHETWLRPAMAELGEVAGMPVLDFGCGHGMAAVVLARRGAHVTAFDLSEGYLAEARQRARANHVAVDFIKANGERLPFADRSFARIWGHAILHHVDLKKTAPELRRILKPGGVAVFCEPWGENPLLDWIRRCCFSNKSHTEDEQPFAYKDITHLKSLFTSVQVRGHQLLGSARRFVAASVVDALDWCDHQVLARLPRLERFCRYVAITLRP